jgi:hypothetical protein
MNEGDVAIGHSQHPAWMPTSRSVCARPGRLSSWALTARPLDYHPEARRARRVLHDPHLRAAARRRWCPRPSSSSTWTHGQLPEDKVGPLARYVAIIQGQRGDYNVRVLSVRHEDLRSLAVIYDKSPANLTEELISWGVLDADTRGAMEGFWPSHAVRQHRRRCSRCHAARK